MPTLEITSSTTDPHALFLNGGQVLATMLAPADAVTRGQINRLLGSFAALTEAELQEAVLTELMNNYWLSEKRWRSGRIAGQILHLVRQIDEHTQDIEAGVGKAVHILQGTYKVSGKLISRSVAMQAWGEFKSVSHLWVAADPEERSVFPKNYVPKPEYDHPVTPELDRQWNVIAQILCWTQDIISIAEPWRQFGESFRNRQGALLFDPNKTWAPPTDYDLLPTAPDGQEFECVVPPLSDQEIGCLESYSAPVTY